MIKYSTIEEVNATTKYTYFKFVKVGTEYRFVDTEHNWRINHIDMVTPAEYPLVNGAGTICVTGNSWHFTDTYSITLQSCGCKSTVCNDLVCDELDLMIGKEYGL